LTSLSICGKLSGIVNPAFAYIMVKENLLKVRERIANAAQRSGRRSEDIKLIVVTKRCALPVIEEAIAHGVTDIGENRVQDAEVKFEKLGGKARWHMIGHLQTNKAKDAVRLFDVIQSADSMRLAQALDNTSAGEGKRQEILLQVNVSGEESKSGVVPEEASGLLKNISTLKHLRVLGLMTMAPIVTNPEETRQVFRRLRELRDELNNKNFPCGVELKELSMGMTQDFEVAIEEGATMVRIGTAIFGAI
jgi:pyridoxal phosphate enzyme (YggS family)